MAFLDKIHPLLKRTRENKYSDSNYAILNAIDKQLEEMELETIQSKSQSAIYTATGWFLDNAWGNWFGVKRKTGESDSDYRDRIIEKVNVPRGTVESVKYGIREFLENEYIGIEIYEPWEDIFYLNRVESRLNGKHHLIGEYYNYGVMDITVGETFPKDMLDVIDLFKPAGVTVHVNVDTNLPSNDPNEEKELLSTHKLNVYDSYKEYERTVGMFEGIMGKFSIFDKVSVIDGKDFVLRNGYVYGDLPNEVLENGHEFFNTSEAKANTMLNEDKGLEYSEPGSATSGPIPVKPNTELISNYPIEVISTYDESGKFLGSVKASRNLTSNADNIYRVDMDDFWDNISSKYKHMNNENRNLVINSDFKNIIEIGHSYKNGWQFTGVEPTQDNGVLKLNYSEGGNPSVRFVLWVYNNENIFIAGQTYVFSIKIKASSENRFFMRTGGTIGVTNQEWFDVDNKYRVLTFSFTPGVTANTGAIIGYTSNPGSVEIDWVKLEKGTVATPWTPAPEDYDIASVKVGFKNAPSDLSKISIKEPDYSLLNSRTDLIRGNTETLNGFDHVVGIGTGFTPSPNFRLQDLDERTEIKEPTDLSLPNNNLGYVYTVFDLSHFYTKHSDKIIENDRYSYIDYLSNNNFTISLGGETGRTYEVEYYNFLNKEWELLERNLFKESTSIVSKQIDMHKALNDNLIIILRVKTFNRKVNIKDMFIEYRYSKELPISVTGSNTGHSLTLSDEKLYNEVLPYG